MSIVKSMTETDIREDICINLKTDTAKDALVPVLYNLYKAQMAFTEHCSTFMHDALLAIYSAASTLEDRVDKNEMKRVHTLVTHELPIVTARVVAKAALTALQQLHICDKIPATELIMQVLDAIDLQGIVLTASSAPSAETAADNHSVN
jgi:hypothetical protein